MNKQVLLTGDYWHADFADLVQSVKTTLLLVPFQNLSELEQGSHQIGLVVLAQSRRSQFPREAVKQLMLRFPGVPLINLLGSWCEGESRSGEPYEGWTRLYWYQWWPRFDDFVVSLESGTQPLWSLPRTATEADQVFLSASRTFLRQPEVVAVFAKSSAQYEMLADALDVGGYLNVWCRDEDEPEFGEQVACLVVDADSLTEEIQQDLLRLAARFPDRALVLLLGFPRREEIQRAREIGVDEIVAKPFRLGDLKFALREAMERRVGSRRSGDNLGE